MKYHVLLTLILVSIWQRSRLIRLSGRSQGTTEKKGLLELMESKNINFGIVVTKSLFEKSRKHNKEILFIPAWLFLLAF